MKEQIIKLGNNTYIKGIFKRHNEKNRAGIIDYPLVFKAFGSGIRSGNWRSGTSVNTPLYIEKTMFNKDIELCKNIDTPSRIKILIFNIQILNKMEEENSPKIDFQIEVLNNILTHFDKLN